MGFKAGDSRLGVQGWGFKAGGSRLGVQGWGSRLGVQGWGFKAGGSRLGVQGLGFKAGSSRLGVQGWGEGDPFSDLKGTEVHDLEVVLDLRQDHEQILAAIEALAVWWT